MSYVGSNHRFPLTRVLNILAGNIPDSDTALIVNWFFQGEPDYREMARQPEAIQTVKGSIRKTMKLLVDQWIASGKNAGGADCPLDRNVNWTSPAFPVPLETAFCALITLQSEGPREEMQPDGKRRLVRYLPHFDNTLHEGRESWSDALNEHGQRLAMFSFAQLLDSSYSYHIARCDGCKGYFAYERKPRRTIKRGIFCKDCKPRASLVRTKASRETERGKLLDLAAKFWPQWTERKHPNRALWIAEKINAQRKGTERRITQKWVSRNIDIRTGKVKENAKG